MFGLLHTKSPQLISPFFVLFCDLRTHLRFFQCKSVSNQKQLKETSFTVSYLINSCGLSPQAANSASKKVKFVTPEKPDSVLGLLTKHGFSNSQITKVIKSYPQLLLADPETTILPKLEFFSSVGVTGSNLAKLISSYPPVLSSSLRNRIVPGYEFLRRALLFDDELVIKAVSNPSRIFKQDVEKISAPNLLVLREVGMPQSVIQQLLIHDPTLLCFKVDKFRNKIKEVINMGFWPTETKFIKALAATSHFSESNWQHRIEVYKRCGWSKDEILSAFKKYPQCMCLSEKKIIGGMDFLVNVMNLNPSTIAANPMLLLFSLKKRIIPRGLVIKYLKSKGKFEKNMSFHSVLQLTDKCFLERYVDKHREHIPYLLDVFEGRMCPQELGLQHGH